MELGQYILDELQESDRSDTLTRWMAHHVAELIQRAEATWDLEEGQVARAEAFEAILKLWEKRFNIPGNVDPLKKYRAVIETLYVLSPEAEAWERYQHSRDHSPEHLHYDLTQISLGNILREIVGHKPLTDREERIVERFLEPDEKVIIRLIYDAAERAAAPSDEPEQSAMPIALQIRHRLIKRLDDTEKALKELKAVVEQEIKQFYDDGKMKSSKNQKKRKSHAPDNIKPRGIRKKPPDKTW